jgi:hypothetical protein
VILLLASELDGVAAEAAANWPNPGANLLTPRDLSEQGWHIETERITDGWVVASGRKVSVAEITGIVNVLPWIFEYELFAIEEADRSYVAAEMISFLLYVLTAVSCPVLNKPTPPRFNGPDWRHEQWIQACRRCGIPAKPGHRNSRSSPVPSNVECVQCVTVIGNRCIIDGDPNISYGREVEKLARLANVGFLKAAFSREDDGYFFHSAQLIPDLSNPHVVEALHSHFTVA